MFLIFLEDVKISSVSLNRDRPQLQHWLLYLEHNTCRSENSNVVAGPSVPMGYDCVYDSACDSYGPFGFGFEAPILVEFESCGLQLL